MQETYVQSLGQEDPLEEGMATHSVFLPGESQGQRNLAGYSPQGRKALARLEQLSTLAENLTSAVDECDGKGPELWPKASS